MVRRFPLLLLLVGCASAPRPALDLPDAPSVRNVILLIADGCGYNHVDAASLYEHGVRGSQVYESFPVKLAMTTHPLDPESLTDSAAAATSMSTGFKTYPGAIGVDGNGDPLIHAFEVAWFHGKATGVVTSVPWSHATPAGFVAHNPSRGSYAEIAREMLGSPTEVIMGTGHPMDPPVSCDYVGGEMAWMEIRKGTYGHLVQDRDEFLSLAEGPTPDRVIGIPRVHETIRQDPEGPTLAEMTRAALNVLDDDPDGFCLVIEGGAVDWAAHNNDSLWMIEEEMAFNRAVEAVVDWVETGAGWKETLVIVTGDHECGLLTAPGEDPDPSTPLSNSGPGTLPWMQWNTTGHSREMIPLYAKGRGSRVLLEMVRGTDPVRGPFLDNTDIGRLLLPAFQP